MSRIKCRRRDPATLSRHWIEGRSRPPSPEPLPVIEHSSRTGKPRGGPAFRWRADGIGSKRPAQLSWEGLPPSAADMICAGNSTDSACGSHGQPWLDARRMLDRRGDGRGGPMSRTPTPIVRIGQTPPPTIPGYELLHRVGQGGMGEVYVARQLNLGRLVAVKFLAPEPDVEPHEAL